MKSDPAPVVAEVAATDSGLLGLPDTDFVAHYWQRRPLLARGVLTEAEMKPVNRDTLLAAAAGGRVESRLVVSGDQFFGPFPPDRVPASDTPDWALLVQDMDREHPAARALLDRFDFLPHWRIDDLMIGLSGPGGGAGPHVDQYDVFLVQAAGTKRWAIDLRPDPDLAVDERHPMGILRRFEPTHEWLLEPGDLLYLPPGIPHCGTALTPGTTWSVGFRAPSAGELWISFAQHQFERLSDAERFVDSAAGSSNAITAADIAAVRDLLGGVQHTTNTELALCFGRLVTERDFEPTEAMAGAGALKTAPGVRLAWYADDNAGWLFAGGQAYETTAALAGFLGNRPNLSLSDRQQVVRLGGDDLLNQLIAEGYWVAAGS